MLSANILLVKAIVKGIRRHLKPEILKFEKGLKKAAKDGLMLTAIQKQFKLKDDKALAAADRVADAIKEMALGKNDALHKMVRKALQ